MSVQTLWCESGKHQWERPAKRGRRPINCPEHTPSSATEPSRPRRSIDPLAKAREIKAQRAQEREHERREQERQELSRLREQLPTLSAQYEEALTIAVAAKSDDAIESAFNRADSIQNMILGISKRIRRLEGTYA